jgi:HlyD family secretion protein
MTSPASPSTDEINRTLGVSADAGRKVRRKRVLIVALVLLMLAAVLLLRSNRPTAAATYVTQPAKRGDLVVTVSATGTLDPIKEVDVGIEVSGTIKDVAVDYNDEVKVGQVLARLDTTRLEAQALQSKAALESAKAKVLQAQATVQEAEAKWTKLNRVRELSGGKMPAQSDLDVAHAVRDRATADERSARAQVDQAQATLNANETDLTKAVIRSPIDGVVLVRKVEPGQTLAASFESPVLFSLAEDLKQIKLLVDVDEADVGSVRSGQDAIFTVDAYPDRKFPAQITQVRYGSETVDGVVTYKAVLRVDNSELLLRPGMTATAVITVKRVADALLVPNAALRFAPPEAPASATGERKSLVSSLIPHPPRQAPKKPETGNGKSRQHRVWTVRDGLPVALVVVKGVSDGIMTEVQGEGLSAGTELITDLETALP